jgi:hypothetical protein
MNITHTTLKKIGDTELISTAESLRIGPFILNTSHFQLVVRGGIVYIKYRPHKPSRHFAAISLSRQIERWLITSG